MKTKREKQYDFQAIEHKWRPIWEADDLYKTGDDPRQPAIYILDYFPYPSGSGLSVGHCRNYVPTCIASRYMRMRGFNVLHPMGWDAFGMPAENYAISHNIHPRQSTQLFSNTYRRQMELVACSYDWSREIDSTQPDYYRWTQAIFLLLFRRGLAYQASGDQWWCTHCQTILANEQVKEGHCWRCGRLVTQKRLRQWYFKITAYADRLIADLDQVRWPEAIKAMQRNWIGRSEGADIMFPVVGQPDTPITVFTTRVDTLFGVTFLALAPEHPMVPHLVTPAQEKTVAAYLNESKRKSEIERSGGADEKSGVFSGSYARHPSSGDRIPIWVADYVLPGYGYGAVMGVPAHDARDLAFARRNTLPVVPVIQPEGDEPAVGFSGEGTLRSSGVYDGLPSAPARERITADLATNGFGGPAVTTRLRDWLISRQRYWGTPIPIIHCLACGPVPVPEEELPVRLPEMDDFAPTGDGRSPLARARDWVATRCPECGGDGQRETDTMDGFACSSWYFLRFANPHYTGGPFDPQAVKKWLPVDMYVGGAEHAVMHLLYARFWTKVMYDAGWLDFSEPFTELRNQGMLLSPQDGHKMSKSRGNVVTPDEVIARVGTDALRIHVVFLGPFDAAVMWDEQGLRGATRFIERYWRLAGDMTAPGPPEAGAAHSIEEKAFIRRRHEVVQRVSEDMDAFRFNTVVSTLMGYLNELTAFVQQEIRPSLWREGLSVFTRLLAPIAPFVTEEVWQVVLGCTGSVHRADWPTFSTAKTIAAEVTVVVQVDGKVRDRLLVARGLDEKGLKERAAALPNVRRFVEGKTIKKVIVIPDKLVNIVVS